jgi:hypothetical protein
MHSRLLVTESLKSFEVEVVNDLTIELVPAIILCIFVRLSTQTQQELVGFQRYIYDLGLFVLSRAWLAHCRYRHDSPSTARPMGTLSTRRRMLYALSTTTQMAYLSISGYTS